MNNIINKSNYKYFLVERKPSDNPKLPYAYESVQQTDTKKLLEQCRDMYDHLGELRERCLRYTNYALSDQWSDKIVDPSGLYWGSLITERDYIKRDGKVPLQYNVIGKIKDTILGVYRGGNHEPMAIARERGQQKLGEMMTIALQYAYNANNIQELNKHLLENGYCKGIVIRGTYFKRNNERQINDVYIENIPLEKVFFNSDVNDPLFRDIRIIGVLRDYTPQELVAAYAPHNPSMGRRLLQEYANHTQQYHPSLSTHDAFSHQRNLSNDFYLPTDYGKCRVYEIWSKETQQCYSWHDRATGTIGFRPLTQQVKAEFDAINQDRVSQFVSFGADPEEVPLIEYETDVRTYWYFRYLTPYGRVIAEGETPFEHNSHPFTIAAYPMINGEIHSPVEKLIDMQRIINRMLTQFDFVRQNSAHGLKMIPTTALGNLTPREFAEQYTQSGGWLFYTPKVGMPEPKVIQSASVSAGDIDMLQVFLRLNEDISGVTAALRGEVPKSGTPAALYQQQAMNSATNVADFLAWFNTFITSADYKMMKVIQQYYTDKRYIPIAGKQYSDESRYYDPDKIRNSEYDIVLAESTSTPAYRQLLEEKLDKFLEMQAIDLRTYLEMSQMPYADTMLETLKRREEEISEQQQQQQQITATPPQ